MIDLETIIALASMTYIEGKMLVRGMKKSSTSLLLNAKISYSI